MYTLTIGFFGTLPQPPKIMCAPPRVLLTFIISLHPPLVMGHNVQITYILWGIPDTEGRVLLEEMVDTVEPIRRPQCRPSKRPKKLHAYLRPTKPRPTRQRSAERLWVGPASRAECPGRAKKQREAGAASVDSGAHVVSAVSPSALKDTLRAASRYPPGVPPSGRRVDLELRPAVALSSSVAHSVLCYMISVRYLTDRLGNRKKVRCSLRSEPYEGVPARGSRSREKER